MWALGDVIRGKLIEGPTPEVESQLLPFSPLCSAGGGPRVGSPLGKRACTADAKPSRLTHSTGIKTQQTSGRRGTAQRTTLVSYPKGVGGLVGEREGPRGGRVTKEERKRA